MAYAPADNLTSSATLAGYPVVYYEKVGLDRLEKKFQFRKACDEKVVPKSVGRTVQWYRYSNFSANTTPATEGAIGSGLTMTSKIVTATLSQYVSFVTVSDFLQKTALNDQLEQAADLLGYSAGLSVDTITRNVIDAEQPSTALTLSSASSTIRVADLRIGRSVLQAVDVEPMSDNQFLVILHPYVSFDLVNDPAVGGYADIFKYTAPKGSALTDYEDRGTIMNSVAGCKVIESTNTYASGGVYRSYIFGKGAVFCVALAGSGPSDVVDPKNQKFKITVGRETGPALYNPEGTIAGFASYNFIYSAVIPDGPAGIGGTYRFRTWETQSSIG